MTSLDYQAFVERVRSFTCTSWCRADCGASLSPLHLARLGWAAVEGEERVVRCTSCREVLSLALPSVTSPVFQHFLAKQSKRVESGHAEFCPWGASHCPHVWALPQVDLAEWQTAAKLLCSLGSRLPFLPRTPEMLGLQGVMARLAAKLAESDGSQEVRETASWLAVLGWQEGGCQPRAGGRAVPDTLTDVWGVRRVGLWNFRSLEEEEDRRESRRVASQLAGEEVKEEEHGEEHEEGQAGKKVFNPLMEHLSWNPTRSKEGLQLLGEQVDTINLTIHTLHCKFKVVSGKVEEEGKKEPGEALSRVRQLLDQWC